MDVLKSPLVLVPAVLGFVVLAIVGLFAKPAQQIADDDKVEISAEWNKTVGRLGILPLYPPQEDFYVGDVWAVISEVDNLKTEDAPLVGRAIRIFHLDMRPEILESKRSLPTFAETKFDEQGKAQLYAHERSETQAGFSPTKIDTTLVAFPGLTIKKARQTEAAASGGFLGFGASSADSDIEEIKITDVETYGAPLDYAWARMLEWCEKPKKNPYCTDELVREMLAYGSAKDVLKVRDKKYVYQIELRLVNQVFMSRRIVQSRIGARSAGAAAALSADPTGEAPRAKAAAASDNPDASTDAEAKLAAARASAANGGRATAAALEAAFASGRTIAIDQTMRRPVAFGYKAVSTRLPPSTPREESVK